MRIRRFIGALYVVNFILVALWVFSDTGSDFSVDHFWPIAIAVLLWTISSLIVKISMIIERKWLFANLLAVLSFLTTIIFLEMWTIHSSSGGLSPFALVTGTIWLFGGFIIDLLDLINCRWPFFAKKESMA